MNVRFTLYVFSNGRSFGKWLNSVLQQKVKFWTENENYRTCYCKNQISRGLEQIEVFIQDTNYSPLIYADKILYRCYMFRRHTILRELTNVWNLLKYIRLQNQFLSY